MLTEQLFLRDVAKHQMTILRDDGVYRDVLFKEPGTGDQHFNLITWPHHLCICGDMGTYVFSRVEDMFRFFRVRPEREDGSLHINVGYWSEKLQAVHGYGSTAAGPIEFDMEAFAEAVHEAYKNYSEWSDDSPEDKRELRDQIRYDVLRAEDEYEAVTAVRDFHHDRFNFNDFWENKCTKVTNGYIWILYAIAWGIQQYDAAKVAA